MKYSAVAALLLALVVQPALAANEYSALLKAKKYAEVERMSNAKLSAEPNNADALIVKSKAILAQNVESRFDEAAKLAEQCIAAHPQKSECHETLGEALGSKAMAGGIMSAIGYAGKIRDAFQKAVELDANNLTARSSLQQYYVMAPGIAGGSTDKAQSLAVETGKINPAAGKLLQARMLLVDDKFMQAESEALAVNAAGSDALQDIQLDVLRAIGFNYVKDKKYGDAERLFRELEKRYPDRALGVYGQARTLQERGKNAEAIPLFEKALAVEPEAVTYYRLGQCLQATSEKSKAAAAFEKAVSYKPALPKKLKAEAEEQLKALRG
jgi:tetratricopeptide (TPR) repeat protein